MNQTNFNESLGSITEPINICFASDNNYVEHLAVALVSILKNTGVDTNLCFHILDGGISDNNKKKLLNLREIKNFEYRFYDMSKYDFSALPMNRSYISVATYYRLLILDILPKTINKLIYLDCDIVVKDDIKKLHDIDLGYNLVGAVEDEGSITQLKRLNLPIENNYFNAGIIVFNLSELRKIDFKEQCFAYYEQNKDIIILQDQDILNGVFNGKCKFLPLRWNANARLYRYNDLEHHYTEEDAKNAKDSPGIIHYTDVGKPWLGKCRHPLQYEYLFYKKFTTYKVSIFKTVLATVLYRLFQGIFSLNNVTINRQNYKQLRLLGFTFRFKRVKGLRNAG